MGKGIAFSVEEFEVLKGIDVSNEKKKGKYSKRIKESGLSSILIGTKKGNNMANDEYIDDSVKFKIKNGILYDYCGSDSEVIIPDGVKVIGSHAFSAALGLEKLIIPEGVEVISDKAFEYCFLLREAILPHSLKKIGTRCFAICNIKELNHPLLKIENGLAIKDNSLLYCADSSLDNVIIPEGIEVINARLSFFNPLNIQLAQHKLHLHGDRQIFQFR